MSREPLSDPREPVASLDAAIEEYDAQHSNPVPSENRGDSPGALISAGGLEEFFAPSVVADAFKARHWTAARELQVLMDMVEDPELKASDKREAIKMLHERRREVLELQGLLRHGTVTVTGTLPNRPDVKVTRAETAVLSGASVALARALDTIGASQDGPQRS